MELLGPNAKRRRRCDVFAAGEPRPPGATEAAANPGPTPQPPDDAGGVTVTGGDDDVDRISGLPDAMLGEIVSLLSTKEAGRTQILASRWRHVWLASPLVLDGADLYVDPLRRPRGVSKDDSDSSSARAISDTLCACPISHLLSGHPFTTVAYEALACAISHLLSAHPGPVRRFCVPSLYLHSRPAAVDAWLSSPALDNLHELELFERHDMRYYVPSYDSYPLGPPPASTFRFSATLRVATLGKCEILYSLVEGIHFPYLKQLGLEDVSISEGSLHTIISSSPVLEYLMLKCISGVACLKISSNSLRSIGVRADVSIGRWNNSVGNPKLLEEVIIVDAPCLERVLYLDAPSYEFREVDLTVIISAPKLEALGCLKEELSRHPRLVFGTTTVQGPNVVSLTTALRTIKTLAVASDKGMNLDMVIELMKCFPCLEKLYIKSYISGGKNRWRRKHKDFIRTFDIRLKTIKLTPYRGTLSQVSFASFFLQNARELESMRLGVEFKDYNEAFFTKQHGMLQMEKRASRGAQLHFTNLETCKRHVHVNHVSDLSIVDPFECRC